MTTPSVTAPVVPRVPLVPVEPVAVLTAGQRARYARHLLLPGLGEEGQRRLLGARVLVVGAGGLGSPVLLYLAAAGVGTLGIVDDDTVEVSNLQRQVLHADGDVGAAKTSSAQTRLRALNPDVAVVEHAVRLDEDNAAGLVSGYDVVVDGSDSFATRFAVADACEALGKPEVWGSVLRFDGQLSVFWSPHGPAYRDLYPEAPPDGAVPSCADVGVSGALCGTIGSLMAAEVVKLITGNGDPLVGRVLVHDGLTGRFRELRVRPDPRRPRLTDPAGGSGGTEPRAASGGIDPRGASGGTDPRAVSGGTEPAGTAVRSPDFTVPAERLTELVAAGEVLIVDVRDPGEGTAFQVPGAVAVPLEDFVDPDVVERLLERAAGRRVVTVCPVGRRSAAAARVLRAAGAADAAHVQGGLEAWLTGEAAPRNA